MIALLGALLSLFFWFGLFFIALIVYCPPFRKFCVWCLVFVGCMIALNIAIRILGLIADGVREAQKQAAEQEQTTAFEFGNSIRVDFQEAVNNFRQKNFAAAETSFKRVISKANKETKSPKLGIALNDLGVICQQLGKISDAERYYRDAESFFSHSTFDGSRDYRIVALKNHATLLRKQNRDFEALGLENLAESLSGL